MRVDAIVQIEQALLTDKQYRAARRLLDNVGQSGHIKLTKEAAKELCGTSSEGALRRLLGQLQAKALIHYSVNGFVYVDFAAFPPALESDLVRAESDHPRALSDHGRAVGEGGGVAKGAIVDTSSARVRAESDHPRALSDHGRAESDHGRANSESTYTHARAGVGWLVGSDPILPNGRSQPTNQPSTDETAAAFGLLCAAGVMPRNARRLAALVSLQRIREAVGYWWDNQDRFSSPGIIVAWLDKPDEAGIPATSTAFRCSDLYRRHLTAAELATDQTTVVEPPPLALPAPGDEQIEPDDDPLQALWNQILQGFATDAPEIFDAWLRDTQLTALDEEVATIVAPRAKCERVGRLERRLRQMLAIHGRRVTRLIVQEVSDG